MLDQNEQRLTVAVNGGVYVDRILTALYASSDRLTWEELWLYLAAMAKVILVSWLVIGDFNQVVDPTEKLGGQRLTRTHTASLWNFLNNGGLIDLGFSGPRYTWTNNRRGAGKIRERLDRAVCNSLWQLRFSGHGVRHLP